MLDHKAGELDGQAPRAFGERIRERAAELGLQMVQLGREAGIGKQSMAGYWNGERLCGSDRLFALSDALRVNARWLVSGVGPRTGGDLASVEDSDFVRLPRFDLREFTDTDKGPRVETVPVRKDWLYRRILTTANLWLTELPADNDPLGLQEGDIVICSDVRAEGVQDNWVCIFRASTGLFVAKYHLMSTGEAGTIGPAGIVNDDVHPIARIHARMIARI